MLQPNQRLGDFEIIRLLGKGGMGEVYEAQQSNPQRRVALKVLKPWLAEDDVALERFKREADVPAQLDHPGVVRIFTTGKADGHVYYVMQLVRGISLAQLVRQVAEPVAETITQPGGDTSQSEAASAASDEPETEDLPSSDALPAIVEQYRHDRFATMARIGMHAAKALDSAHRQGFLHRDIKPSNIMIDHHDQLYLVDFGLTKALDSGTGTRTGAVLGTPWYMSPEQAHGLPLDARSDIYSLGVTLYQLATGGKGPYTAQRGDTDAVLREVRSGTLQPLSSLAPTIAPDLERIINRAVQGDPEQRYQTAGELAADLSTFLQTGTAPQAMLSPKRRSVSPYSVVGIAAIIGFCLVAAFLINNRGKEKEPVAGQQPKPPQHGKPTDPFQRDRPLGTKIHLLREDHKPVAHRILSGKGVLQGLPTELVLKTDGDKPCAVALDDPKQQDYDLSLKLTPSLQAPPDFNDLGVFFGWRENLPDPKATMRFFALKLDTRPVLNDIQGRLYIGTWQLPNLHGALAGAWEPDPRLFIRTASWIPLGPLEPEARGWRQLRVSVRSPKATITVDNEPAHVFDVPQVKQNDKTLTAHDLDTAGMVGIWVRKGVGHFRDITIIPR